MSSHYTWVADDGACQHSYWTQNEAVIDRINWLNEKKLEREKKKKKWSVNQPRKETAGSGKGEMAKIQSSLVLLSADQYDLNFLKLCLWNAIISH